MELTIYVVAFITLSGLMAAVEAAILNVSPGEIEEMRLRRAWGADALKSINTRITRPVVVLVIFTNTINVLGPILAGQKEIQQSSYTATWPLVSSRPSSRSGRSSFQRSFPNRLAAITHLFSVDAPLRSSER